MQSERSSSCPTLIHTHRGPQLTISQPQYEDIVVCLQGAVHGINRQDAEDAVQEAWLVVQAKATDLEPGPIGGYLLRTARFKALHIRDKKNKQVSLDGLVEAAGDSVDVLADAHQSIDSEIDLTLIDSSRDPIASKVITTVKSGGAGYIAPRGVHHRNAKYSDQQVKQVRELRSQGLGYQDIEARTGVRADYCSTLVRRESRVLESGEGWTRKSVVDALKHYISDHGQPPRHRDAANNISLPSPQTARRLFGSWREAVRAAGAEPVYGSRRTTQWTDVEIVQALCGWRLSRSHWPSSHDLKSCADLPSPATTRRRLGSQGGVRLGQAVMSKLA